MGEPSPLPKVESPETLTTIAHSDLFIFILGGILEHKQEIKTVLFYLGTTIVNHANVQQPFTSFSTV